MLKLGDVLGIFRSLLLLRTAFFANFLFLNQTITLFTDEPTPWHVSTSIGETLTSISPISIIFCSRF